MGYTQDRINIVAIWQSKEEGLFMSVLNQNSYIQQSWAFHKPQVFKLFDYQMQIFHVLIDIENASQKMIVTILRVKMKVLHQKRDKGSCNLAVINFKL